MQGLRDSMTCAVCLGVYQSGIREPLVLPCGHSFCHICLDAVKRTGNFLCPICRQTHNNVNMEQLSVNYALLSVSSACPDVKSDACSVHGDDQKYWCCNCEMPLCSLCLYSGHPQGHNVMLCKIYIQEKKITLQGKLSSCDAKMEKQKEDVKNKFVELLQGVQGLTQTNSDMHGTRHYMNSILNQIKKADNIGCIRSLDNCVEQFLADFTKNKKVGKEERTSTAAGVGGNMSNGQWVGMGRKQPLPKPNLPVQKCQVAFEDGRLVMHCLGSPIIDGLSLKMPSEVFLELSVGGKCLGRVYINLWTNKRWAQQFLTLCMGTLGPSYRGAMSSKVRNQGKPGENMVFPHHVESGRANEQAIFSNVKLEEYQTTVVEGLLGVPDTQYQPQTYRHFIPYNYQTLDNCQTSGFVIYTIGSPRGFPVIPFGKVFSGLDVVKAAVRHTPKSITISNCGLVLPNSLI